MNNSPTTAFVLQRQIRAMDCPCYEIGVYRREAPGKPAAMLLRQWDTAAIEPPSPGCATRIIGAVMISTSGPPALRIHSIWWMILRRRPWRP